jgi:hypothetical protein
MRPLGATNEIEYSRAKEFGKASRFSACSNTEACKLTTSGALSFPAVNDGVVKKDLPTMITQKRNVFSFWVNRS